MTRRTVFYSGRVQGVGFRFTACGIARSYPVGGFVRNTADGRVQLVVEGEVEPVESFLMELHEEMSANISATNVAASEATGEFRGFEVRR